RDVDPAYLGERPKRLLTVEVTPENVGDRRDELLGVAHREGVHPGRERRRVDPSAVAADEDDRIALAPLDARERDARRGEETQEMDVVHLPGDRERDEREVADRLAALEG